MLRFSLLLMGFSLVGCNQPPSLAPEEIDANLRWLWVHGTEVPDSSLIDAAGKLAAASEGTPLPLKGQMRQRLSTEDLVHVGLESNDPSRARGILVLNVFDCTMDKLESILIAQDQQRLYPDESISYSRTYTSDADAYRQGKKDTINWDITLQAAFPIDDRYVSQIRGGIRRVDAPVDGPTKGPFFIVSSHLASPATFANPSESYIRQEYQVDIYWEQAPGRIFHGYGGWREIKVGGFNLSIEDNSFLNALLENQVQLDSKTTRLCVQ